MEVVQNMSTPQNRQILPRRTILIASLAYLLFSLLAGLEVWLPLHKLMVALLLVLMALTIVRQITLLYLAFHEKPPSLLSDTDEQPLVSILVPAYNEAAVIEASLRSLMVVDYPHLEIIVIDDGSQDDTAILANRVAEKSAIPVSVISQANGGKASALNTGFIHASGDYVLVVDADSRVEPDSLHYGLRHFIDPEIGAVGGFVGVANTQKLICRFQALEYLQSLNFLRKALSRLGMVTVVPGPVGLFRREAILQVGGYREGGQTFAEDADITMKLLSVGWKVAGDLSMAAYTEVPETAYALLRQRYRWRRGIYQAFSDNVLDLVALRSRGGILFALFVASEAFALEVVNFGVTIFFLAHFLRFGELDILSSWYLLIIFMDVVTLMFVCQGDGRFLRNLLLFVLQRFSYAFLLQAWNVIALVDEWRSSEMRWDKLERMGRLETPSP
jgi:biofilm PGA synthesis N-glycosyltransferase PgaC